jgi:hypothetical protein
MPDKHESCNKYDRLSHTSALVELFIADESKKAQEEIQKSCVFRNDNPSLAGAALYWERPRGPWKMCLAQILLARA